jgi:hypothetical protein
MRHYSRRTFLAGLGGLAVAACTGAAADVRPTSVTAPMIAADPQAPTPIPELSAPTVAAQPTPAPAPPLPTGNEERMLMAGTPWQTRLSIRHSGVAGPTAMILGGVHGNEPGGWTAAEIVAGWVPLRGSLLVVPRANIRAIPDFVRTTDEMGDLNRLYPGNPASTLAMERMAAAIVATAQEFNVDLLLDMHESWAFYQEYLGRGAAALGQTITTGVGPRQADFGQQLAAAVNPQMSAREQMIVRDGNTFRRPDDGTPPAQQGRGRSSLAIGGYVDGLTPVLVEMGQENQPVNRRVDLHLITAKATLQIVGVL